MARIRTIKPEFFTSEDIVSLSPLARLLYIGLWCEADKRGRFKWKPKTFAIRWLPGDDCDINALCGELTESGVVVLYGDNLAYIPGFDRHQHVNPRETESDLPDPQGWTDPGSKKVGKNLREEVFERDEYKCVRCGSDDHLQADHILPQSCGGPNVIENLRTLCRRCNAGRPVSGAALDEDLKNDGHSVQSLRVKFGIDASIPDMHAQVGREGKGKERKCVCDTHHTQISEEFRTAIRHRPELDADLVFANFSDHYPSEKRTLTRWKQWVKNERGPAQNGDGAPSVNDPDSRASIETLGLSVGVGKWDELKESWAAYKTRILAFREAA